MKKTMLLVMMCLLFVMTTQCQDIDKWGNIDKADLEMTSCAYDSSAHAMVLQDVGDVKIDYINNQWVVVIEVHKRIKIFDAQGYDHGNVSIEYYSHEKNAKVEDLNVQVFDSKGNKTKIDKKDIYEEQSNKYWSKIKFAAPNLEPGCIVEYKYRMIKQSTFRLTDWYFQSTIPVRISDLKVEYPSAFGYTILTQGGSNLESEKSEGGRTYRGKAYRKKHTAIDGLNNDGARTGTSMVGGGNFNMSTIKQHYTLRDAPAFEVDAYTTSAIDYMSKIKFQLQYTNFPNSEYKEFYSTWENLRKELNDHPQIGLKISDGSGKNVLKKIDLLQKTSEIEKVETIYNYIKSGVNWNEFTGIYAGADIGEVLDNRSGSVSEINYGLINVLKRAGLEAFPILASTRWNGKTLPIYPLVDQFNYVLAGVEIDSTIYLLDATKKEYEIGLFNKSALNGQAWVFKNDMQGWIDVVANASTKTTFGNLTIDESGKVSGAVTIKNTGYYSMDRSQCYYNNNKYGCVKEDFSKDIEFTQMNYDTSSISKNIFKEDFVIATDDVAKARGDFMYIDGLMNNLLLENPFVAEERNYPVDMHYAKRQRNIMNYKLPEGYAVETLPQSVNFQFGDKLITYKCSYVVARGNLKIIQDYNITTTEFPKDIYSDLKAFYQSIVDSRSEQVVLEKI